MKLFPVARCCDWGAGGLCRARDLVRRLLFGIMIFFVGMLGSPPSILPPPLWKFVWEGGDLSGGSRLVEPIWPCTLWNLAAVFCTSRLIETPEWFEIMLIVFMFFLCLACKTAIYSTYGFEFMILWANL